MSRPFQVDRGINALVARVKSRKILFLPLFENRKIVWAWFLDDGMGDFMLRGMLGFVGDFVVALLSIVF
ncbi:hypothetical protein QQP08_022174, partial [Theobroma cacao]